VLHCDFVLAFDETDRFGDGVVRNLYGTSRSSGLAALAAEP
jgi:hypothetical protein